MDREYTRDEKLRFKELVNCLHDKYNRKCNWLVETSWWNTLKDFEYDDIKAAILEHCSQSPFMPQESEIAKIIKGSPVQKQKPTWSDNDEILLSDLKKQYLEAVNDKNPIKMIDLGAKTSAMEIIKKEAVG